MVVYTRRLETAEFSTNMVIDTCSLESIPGYSKTVLLTPPPGNLPP
jgi:hypothetical protein